MVLWLVGFAKLCSHDSTRPLQRIILRLLPPPRTYLPA